MLRALFAGVSGLRNNQTRLDVIGNNIANVNTIGFKASRVTFEEAFAQTIRGASRPTANQGGVNPMQIGLGMNVASIDQNFTQGNLESTGVRTDLAIQGDAFFVVNGGNSQFYTRAGNFTLDGNGRLVSPNNGGTVQGITADSSGNLPSGVTLTDIILPLGQVSAAQATGQIVLRGNLDARVDPLGTILRSAGSVYAIEQTTSNGGMGSDLNGLYANGTANQQIIGMTPTGTTVTITDGTTSQTYTYVAQDTGVGDMAFNSLSDLIGEINNNFTTLTAALNNTSGAVEITAGAGAITLNMGSSNATLASAFASVNGALAAAATAASDEFSHVAEATDLVVNLRDGSGAALGATAGSTIDIDADVGGTAVGQGNVAVTGTTTYQDLLTQVNSTLGVSNSTGAQIDAGTGALIVNGDGGSANALSGLNVRVQGGAAGFDAIFDSRPNNYLETQMATDVEHQLATTVFDSLGNQTVLTVTFTKDPTSINRWTWQAAVPPPSTMVGGAAGVATFDDGGRLESFTYNGGSSSLQFTPSGGSAALVDVNIDAGMFGDINGLSQFGAPSNAVVSSQDGRTMGVLQDYTIDDRGIITGIFDNGESQTIAQIAVVAFSNPSGLVRRGDGMYDLSANSGDPIVGFVGTTNQSRITPGAIEGSNVDLAQEFTSMIIAQRGFQASARVITTADEMLTELVNLKR